MAENFGDADDGEIFGVDDSVATAARMRSPPTPKNSSCWLVWRGRLARETLQSFDQLRAIHFAGASPAEIRIRTESIVTAAQP